MNALVLLMGLLLLSYVGSFLVGGRAIRGFGLPSGTEYIVLGLVLGPHVLGVVDRTILDTFDPLADVALGWLAFVIGLDFGVHGGKRARLSQLVAGPFVALVTGATVAFATWWVVTALTPLAGVDRLLLVGGTAAACAETTRHAVFWAVERYGAKGPVSDMLGGLAGSDDVVPLLAVAVLFSLRPLGTLPGVLRAGTGLLRVAGTWTVVTLGVGVVLGTVAAVLIGRDFRRDETWGVLLGVSLLGIGISARLGLAPISTLFALGLTLAMMSRHRDALRQLVAPTERPVLHPALLLAGAHLAPTSSVLPFLVLFALAARFAAKAIVGVVVQVASPRARAAGPMLGMGLLPCGALAMAVGLSFALRFPGAVGDAVLATAAAATVVGEFLGPAALRSALRQAGEIAPVEPVAFLTEDAPSPPFAGAP